MKKYETKTINTWDYDSFMFLEGQTGLPEMIDEIYQHLHGRSNVWVLEELFTYPDRIHAIPILNPDVLIFQTTLLSRDKIDSMIYLLEAYKWKPKEIWQIINHDIPIVNSNEYNIFSPCVYNGRIELTKL